MDSLFIDQPGQPRLHYRLARTEKTPRAAVLITTGFGEHTCRYEPAIDLWTRRGYLVAIHDLRGQGKSEGRPGHIERFEDYLLDFDALLEGLARDEQWQAAGKPILFGHSYGCLISTFVALKRQVDILGLALSSPFFAQALKVPRIRLALGRAVSKFWPTYSDKTGITGAMVTHDPEMAADSEQDPLRIERVTARWFTETEAAHGELLARAGEISVPVYCQVAGADLIASVDVTRQVIMKMSSVDKQLVVREGQHHELHREVERIKFLGAFADAFDRWTEPVG